MANNVYFRTELHPTLRTSYYGEPLTVLPALFAGLTEDLL